jgi:DnaA family protein
MTTTTQLTLSVSLRDEATFDNYVTDNQALMHDLKAMADGRGEQSLFLFGPPSTGKTHLLEATCMAAHAAGRQAHFLPLGKSALPPDCLEELEYADIVCLDDVHCVLEDRAWEEALFHFFNRAKSLGCRLVFSANAPLNGLSFVLPDLQSRLAWGLIYGIKAPNDDERRAILQWRAQQRGLRLPDAVVNYLMHHYSRDVRELLSALDKLDRASLMLKQGITLGLVKTVLFL